jgi:hypothetical protein
VHPDPADLSRHELFEGLDQGQLQQLASWFEIEEFTAGEPIVRGALAMFGTRFRELQQELPAVAERLQAVVTQRSA